MVKRQFLEPKLLKVLERVARNIERLRKERDLTQAETAEKMDGDLRWYQRLESGRHALSLSSLVRLAQVFKVDVSELFKHPS